jgi:hypothetical protein
MNTLASHPIIAPTTNQMMIPITVLLLSGRRLGMWLRRVSDFSEHLIWGFVPINQDCNKYTKKFYGLPDCKRKIPTDVTF